MLNGVVSEKWRITANLSTLSQRRKRIGLINGEMIVADSIVDLLQTVRNTPLPKTCDRICRMVFDTFSVIQTMILNWELNLLFHLKPNRNGLPEVLVW